MDEQRFKERTKRFALDIITLMSSIPMRRVDYATEVLCKQLLRAATSVGANYRAACRGRSTADVMAKLGVVEEEADESLYWLELLVESKLIPGPAMADLMREADELAAMTVASIKTLRGRR